MILNPLNEPFDIIVVAGQSNALGYGIGETKTPFEPSSNIYMLNDTENVGYFRDSANPNEFLIKFPRKYAISIATERTYPGGYIGSFALSFASEYIKTNKRKVLIIQSAVGATGFYQKQWTKNGVLRNRLFEMLDLSIKMHPENKIVAFLWHQGEHDASNLPNLPYQEKKALHQTNLSTLFGDIRAKYGNFPIIAGGFVQEWYSQNKQKADAIIDATKCVLNDIKNSSFVTTEDLTSNNQVLKNNDIIHFSRNALDILGKRYFNEFTKINN